MSSELKEIQVEGIISRTRDQYTITTDDGINYDLSVILPWESVAPDYGTGVFTQCIGKRVNVAGLTDGHTIWKAQLININ
jgi:hypothetical protein